MKILNIISLEQFKRESAGMKTAYLLLYRAGSESSDCALKSLKELPEIEGINFVFTADVTVVRDIHPEYGIDSVPGLLELNQGKLVRTYKGCNGTGFYYSVFTGGAAAAGPDVKHEKRVTVYTTPTCSWCTTLKNYLREKRVNFRETDVSVDQKAAEDMVRRSGQQGVPQTDINGTMIGGFDKKKIDELLDSGR